MAFCSKTLSDNLQGIQNYAMHIILIRPARTSSDCCLWQLGWLTLFQHCCTVLLWQVHKCFLYLAPTYLSYKFISNSQFGYSHTHGSENFHLSSLKTNFGRYSLTFRRAAFYNSLPLSIRQIQNRASFLKACSAHLYKTVLD